MLSEATVAKIDEVFRGAAAEGRRVLLEHEVYALLAAVGLDTPRWRFARSGAAVDADFLAAFPGEAFVKVVSPQVAHKSKIGGVKRVRTEDPLFVRYVLDRMREEVLARHRGPTPVIEGFLFAELVPFTQALGEEILFGAREDPSFGPVLTLSKGGDDAEFFARRYDPANLVLAPVEAEEAALLCGSLKIKERYEEMGRHERIGMIAATLVAVSRLVHQYSFIAASEPRYYLEALDLNPFVFAKDGRFVAVDGFAQFSTAEERGRRAPRRACGSLKSFFEPAGILVAGVSSDPAKYSMAREILELLADMGRTDLYPVNPKGGSARAGGQDWALRASPAAVTEPYDLAVYAAPAPHCVEFLRALPDGKAVVLIPGLPIDMPFPDFAAAVAAQRARGIRVIGPNCMGVFRKPEPARRIAGLDTLFIGEERLRLSWTERSNAALLTQSGAMAITSIERNQYAPIFKAIVSFGNKADVDVPELLRHFAAEEGTAVVALYLEGLGPGEGRDFFEAALQSPVPVVAYKAGRTEAGSRAAASHTAAMTGSYEVFASACAQAGVVLCEELPAFYDAMKAFSVLAPKRVRGNRVAGVVNAGLDATMGADLLGGLIQAALAPATEEKLRGLNRHGLVNVGASFLDVTPMTDDAMFADICRAVLADPGVDCLFVAVVPHVENLKAADAQCRDADAIGPLLVEVARASDKPVVVSINAGVHYQGLVRVIEEGGLPVFTDIRSAMGALETFARHRLASRG